MLRNTLRSLEPGGTSSIVYADGVFYILHLEDRRAESEGTIETAQPMIEREMRQQQSEILYKAWIERLRAKAYVKVFDAKL